jgi:glyoxylase-like metal-dependent hydrolase (beta-lactamase superfamily II)
LAIHRVLENIFLVDLDLPPSGFYRFISSWIIKRGDRAIIIDPGPSATIATLVEALREIGINGIDYILLTHIHLDHAGGCGDLIKGYPDPVIVCHPQAVDHLSNPERLWQGSVNVLGDLARAFGQPSPVDREKICSEPDIRWKGHIIQSLETPGHASHHMCFFLRDLVFAGEVAGVMVLSGNRPYIRPATPPPFRPEIALKSISLVIERGPQIICYGHYGFLRDAVTMLKVAQEQINSWLPIIEGRRNKGLSLDKEEILGEILARDPYMRRFPRLEPDIRERELYFIKNSIKGMLGFINR